MSFNNEFTNEWVENPNQAQGNPAQGIPAQENLTTFAHGNPPAPSSEAGPSNTPATTDQPRSWADAMAEIAWLKSELAILTKQLTDYANGQLTKEEELQNTIRKLREEKRASRAKTPVQAPPQAQPERPMIHFQLPKRFSGSNKDYTIENFRTHLKIYFNNNWRAFPHEGSKIWFIISLLEGGALSYVTPFIDQVDDEDGPYMFLSAQHFLDELERMFGTPNKKRFDERDLLQLKQTGDIVHYVAKFQTIMASLNWKDEAPLMMHFRVGLSSEVREELNRMPAYRNLQELIDTAVKAYQGIQERKSEKTFWQDKKEVPLRRNPIFNRPTTTNTPRAETSGPTPMELDSIKPRKLTAEEKKRRRTEGLCLYCGAKGHFASKCPEKKSSVPRSEVQAAVLEELTEEYWADTREKWFQERESAPGPKRELSEAVKKLPMEFWKTAKPFEPKN